MSVRIDKILTKEDDRPRISASSIKDWFSCQYKWKVKNIDKFKSPANIYLVTGTMFHWTQELTDKRGSELPNGKIDDKWFDALWAMVREEYQNGLRDNYDHAVVDPLYKEGKETLEPIVKVLFTEGIHLLREGGPILASEAWAKLDVPHTDYYLHGYIDRLFTTGFKWDFKTSKAKWGPFKKYGEVQHLIYPAMTLADITYFTDGNGDIQSAPMPKPEIEDFKFFVAIKHKRPKFPNTFQTDWVTTVRGINELKRQSTMKMITSIVREIEMHKEADDWIPNVLTGMCNYCDVRKAGLCPSMPKFIDGVDNKGE